MMRTRMAVVASLTTVALLTPAGAQAYDVLYSWQGNDRSWNNSTGKTLSVCDGEDDGNQAEGQRWTSSGVRDEVRDDATAGCASLTLSTTMYRHRVVELQLTDAVGPMRYLW